MKKTIFNILLLVILSVPIFGQAFCVECKKNDQDQCQLVAKVYCPRVDCKLTNYDTIKIHSCGLENEIVIKDSLVLRTEECQPITDIVTSSNSTVTGQLLGWQYGYQKLECPLWTTEVCYCGTQKFGSPSLTMVALEDDCVGSWTGKSTIYFYDYPQANRLWARPYSETGGYLTGWLQMTQTIVDWSMCRDAGGDIVYIIDGNTVATANTNYTGPLWVWNSVYFHTNLWGTGTHELTNLTYCPNTTCGPAKSKTALPSNLNQQTFFKEFTDEEAKAIVTADLEEDGLSTKEIKEILSDMFIGEKIDGIHDCYYTDAIDEIIANKTIGGNHNPVLKILGLSNKGNEQAKVERIIAELEKRGLR